MSSSRREKRLGDMMAGTVVLNEHSAPQALATPPAWVPPALQPWVLSLDLHRLDDRLALAVRQFAGRAYAMTPAARHQLGETLRARVLAVTTPPPPPWVPTHDLLLVVLAERRRRATVGRRPGRLRLDGAADARPGGPPAPRRRCACRAPCSATGAAPDRGQRRSPAAGVAARPFTLPSPGAPRPTSDDSPFAPPG